MKSLDDNEDPAALMIRARILLQKKKGAHRRLDNSLHFLDKAIYNYKLSLQSKERKGGGNVV